MSSVADDVLVVHGLRAGTAPDDTLPVSRGEVGEVRYLADRPGTYFYRASASQRPITSWTGIDAQLAGAIIVDPGSTFRMEWVPTRAGNWIFHCHILDHAQGGLLSAVQLGLPVEDFRPMMSH